MSHSVNHALLNVAMRVCSKVSRDPDSLIDDPHAYKEELVTSSEWKVLSNYTNIYGNSIRPDGHRKSGD